MAAGRLTGKVAVITGAGSGIGRASALKFAQEGAKVVVSDISERGGQETIEMLKGEGLEASFFRADVADFAQVQATVEHAVNHYGDLHIMFNNAGTGHFAPLLMHEPDDYDRVVKVNQYGVYYGILAAARKMVERETKGVIINTSSVFSVMASHGVFGYHAAKGAVTIMTKSAALELSPFGIRVVAIAPGGTDTQIIQGYKDMGLEAQLAGQQMRGELQRPEDIANTAAFLASDEANAINGTLVMTDDGFSSFKSAPKF